MEKIALIKEIVEEVWDQNYLAIYNKVKIIKSK